MNKKHIEAAERFIAANKSDPFIRARVYTHMRNGIASFLQNGEDAFYHATAVEETVHLPAGDKLSNGDTSFIRTAYKNLVRP